MTNAEFLNANFGTNYKAWMKSRWMYSPDIMVWMINFAEEKDGWKNKLIGNDIIEESYFGDLNSVTLITNSVRYRLVVDKSSNYKVLGVFEYDPKSSTSTKTVLRKVSDSIEGFTGCK